MNSETHPSLARADSRVCVVASSPIADRDITSCHLVRLANLFAKESESKVIILVAGNISKNVKNKLGQIQETERVSFVLLPEPEVPISRGPSSEPLVTAYSVFEWMKENGQNFEAVLFEDELVYFCLLAKSIGYLFSQVTFIAVCAEPKLYKKLASEEPVTRFAELTLFFLERKSLELADVTVCGTRSLLTWFDRNGYELEGRTEILPVYWGQPAAKDDIQYAVREIIFDYSSKQKQSLRLFSEAIVKLARKKSSFHELPIITIYFRGKRKSRELRHTIKYLKQYLRNKLVIARGEFEDHSPSEIISRRALVVVTTKAISSLSGAYFFLANKIPFITTSPGLEDLISEEDKKSACSRPIPAALAKKINYALVNGAKSITPSYSIEENDTRWSRLALNLHGGEGEDFSIQIYKSSEPLVSVCITHRNRGSMLLGAIESINRQQYSNVEIIIVDDESDDADSLRVLDELEQNDCQRFPLKVLRQENSYVGAARNNAASHAAGKYLLFMDDDNLAKKDQISVFVSIAEKNKIDILTCFGDLFTGDNPEGSPIPKQRVVFYGADQAVGIVKNPFGDANCFARRKVFDSMNGFSEDYGVGKDDMEFFSRASLSGFKVTVIPKSLFWYRISKTRLRHSQRNLFSGFVRVSEAYSGNLSSDMANIVRYAQGLSYVAGPDGKCAFNFLMPVWLREKIRFFMAKYPALYRIYSGPFRRIF